MRGEGGLGGMYKWHLLWEGVTPNLIYTWPSNKNCKKLRVVAWCLGAYFIKTVVIFICTFPLVKTRWNSSNGPAARLLRWPVFVLHLITYGHTCHIWSHLSPLVTCVTCSYVWISKYIHINFPESHISQEVAFPGSHISQEVTFPRKSHFLGS